MDRAHTLGLYRILRHKAIAKAGETGHAASLTGFSRLR